jgi:hypothetical protein
MEDWFGIYGLAGSSRRGFRVYMEGLLWMDEDKATGPVRGSEHSKMRWEMEWLE